MSTSPADFVIAGSTPFARLLAGLLRQVHRKNVLFIGESHASYRLPRDLDLSVALVTRPQTWSILREGTGEVSRILTGIAGRNAWRHIDPIFFAESTPAREALSHCGQVAGELGVSVERVNTALVGPRREGLVFRDAIRLHRPVTEPALDAWLDVLGVEHLTAFGIKVADDGSSVISSADGDRYARRTVLADDAAILSWLPTHLWPSHMLRKPGATILTTPAKPLPAPAMVDFDSGAMLIQQPEGGIAALGREDLALFSARLQGLLGQERQVEQAGQTAYERLATADGAPWFGRIDGNGANLVVGLGMSGAFFATALARWLDGRASALEAEWFDRRSASHVQPDPRVADFMPDAGDCAA